MSTIRPGLGDLFVRKLALAEPQQAIRPIAVQPRRDRRVHDLDNLGVGVGTVGVVVDEGDGVPDRMLAQGAHDILHADTYTDDSDVARGGGGNDVLHVDDGDMNDLAIGGSGSNDVCVVDFGAEASDTCETVSIP
jgi:hypothetical protein